MTVTYLPHTGEIKDEGVRQNFEYLESWGVILAPTTVPAANQSAVYNGTLWLPATVLQAANNLSDIPNKPTAIDNLGALDAAENLADVANSITSRVNLKLGLGARAHRAAALTLTTAAGWNLIPLDTVDLDPGGVSDTSHFFGGSSGQLVTNGGKFICPVTGSYLVCAETNVKPSASSTVVYGTGIFKNGIEWSEQGSDRAAISGAQVENSLTDIVSANVGDTIELRVFNGGTNTTTLNLSSVCNFLSVMRIS